MSGPFITQSQSYFLFITLALVLISLVVLYFWLKLKRVNIELQESNLKILEVNEQLRNSNSLLELQKESLNKAHNESEKFYGMLVQSADDGISFYDSSWNLRYANHAFYSIIGFDYAAYHSINPDDLVHPDDRDYLQRKVRELNEHGFFEDELRLRHKDGHYIHLSSRSVTVRSDEGETLGSLTISRDISKLKQVHEQLVKANKEAEASNRLKSSFLANISHEIRTPLNSVVGFSNLLLSDDITPEAREEYVEHINFNSEKLLQIISDVIDLSRLESSQIEIRYEETSISSLVDEIANETRVIIKRSEKPVILNVRNTFKETVDLIFTDRVWLKRVLSHLMDNAVKFTLDGTIELFCSLESDKIFFGVKDTGIGINKENLNYIFDEFRQEIDGHHRPFEGLGVGLTLAREVVSRMGGRIFVKSEKGIGSEFGFTLPYRPAGSARLKTPAGTSPGSEIKNWSSKKCLIVDDNKDMLIYLQRILSETGINMVTARSGFEAVQVIKFTPDIDIILLDMQLPGMDGMEVAREIRLHRPEMPIIAQTAFIFEDDKDIIMEAGCNACIIKPIRREQLINTMKGFLKS